MDHDRGDHHDSHQVVQHLASRDPRLQDEQRIRDRRESPRPEPGGNGELPSGQSGSREGREDGRRADRDEHQHAEHHTTEPDVEVGRGDERGKDEDRGELEQLRDRIGKALEGSGAPFVEPRQRDPTGKGREKEIRAGHARRCVHNQRDGEWTEGVVPARASEPPKPFESGNDVRNPESDRDAADELRADGEQRWAVMQGKAEEHEHRRERDPVVHAALDVQEPAQAEWDCPVPDQRSGEHGIRRAQHRPEQQRIDPSQADQPMGGRGRECDRHRHPDCERPCRQPPLGGAQPGTLVAHA